MHYALDERLRQVGAGRRPSPRPLEGASIFEPDELIRRVGYPYSQARIHPLARGLFHYGFTSMALKFDPGAKRRSRLDYRGKSRPFSYFGVQEAKS
jgi:hypothetical protein